MSLKKQRGALSAEAALIAALVVIGIIFIASQSPKLIYKINEIRFMSQLNEVVTETQNWKKNRPNFKDAKIGDVCDATSLDKSICDGTAKGATTTAAATNSFGGTWTITGSTTSGTFDVTATLPDADEGQVNALGDSVAPSTRDQCVSSTSCSTVVVTSGAGGKGSLKMTF
ncbi:hypothetical protein ACP6H1_27295 [Vibrio harveyi]|uniref:hypothetical protein n=1 Tax=Vibrio harveyi TaxID=669 RepID=UPI003CF80AD6